MDMPINEQGFFMVKPGDTIAITVTATNTAYLAKFPKQPVGAKWSSIEGPAAAGWSGAWTGTSPSKWCGSQKPRR